MVSSSSEVFPFKVFPVDFFYCYNYPPVSFFCFWKSVACMHHRFHFLAIHSHGMSIMATHVSLLCGDVPMYWYLYRWYQPNFMVSILAYLLPILPISKTCSLLIANYFVNQSLNVLWWWKLKNDTFNTNCMVLMWPKFNEILDNKRMLLQLHLTMDSSHRDWFPVYWYQYRY